MRSQAMKTQPMRPKILKLAKVIGGLPGMVNKITKDSPEYYSLASVVSDEQAEVAIVAGLRKHRSAEYLAKKSGKDLERTKVLAKELADIGVFGVIQDKKDGSDLYYTEIFAPGILERMVNNREQLAKHPEIGRAFDEYTKNAAANLASMLPMGGSLMRVIPIESALDGSSQAVPFERVSYYLDKYDQFSVSDCSCRASRRIMNEGCGHLEHDVCLHLGPSAKYYADTGKARMISREEAEDILIKAEENGLIHTMPNIEEPGESAAICNCCSCSCFGLRVGMMFGAKDAIRSNYIAKVEEENCVACGQCVENCPSNALKLGQKLDTKTPLPQPKEVKKITEHIWREEDWNVDYRENRENVLETGTSPCKTACPAHIAVQGYIKLAAQGKYMEALELIKKENPFPAVCGRICNHLCENECTRGSIDQPIAIDEVKRFIAEQELNREGRFIPKKRYDCSDKKIAIVGAGPAGLTCAYFLSLDNYDITVFDKEEQLGGMMTLGIPSFRLEKDVVHAEIEVLKELGVKFKTGVEVGKDVTLDELRNEGFKGFYLAIGAQGGKQLGIEGEDAQGVLMGIDFLRNVNLGEKVQLPGKTVVIGGGNVAIDVARTAVRVGTTSTELYCLESEQEMPALPEEVEEATSEGVSIFNGWGPARILTEDGVVKGVEFKKCLSVFDNNGRFAPTFDEEELMTVDADHVIVSIGQTIEWGDLLEGSRVELGAGGRAKADPFTYQSDQPDVFVGGDAYTGPTFTIDAIAAGKQAAISLHRYVQPGQSLTLGRDRRIYVPLDKENVVIRSFDNTPRQQPSRSKDGVESFRDNRMTLTEEQMKKETERCLKCGAVRVDEYLCIGCGQCTTKCKFDAIHLEKVYDVFGTSFEKLPFSVAQHAVKRTVKIAAGAIKRQGKNA